MDNKLQMDKKFLRSKPLPRDSWSGTRSQPSSPLTNPATAAASSLLLGISPLRGGRKSLLSAATEPSSREPSRKSCQSKEDALPIRGGRWPSSSSKKPPINSLEDYLRDESPSDRKGGSGGRDDKSASSTASGPQSLPRMRSCSEFNRFEESKEKDEEQGSRKISKENRPFGSSMRYIGKLRFPKSSSKPDSSPPLLLPGRMSLDDNVVTNGRKTNDSAADLPSTESDRSDSTNKGMSPKIPRARSKDSGPMSVDRAPTAKVAAIRRTSSLTGKGGGKSQWALSPAGRRSSSPAPLQPAAAATADGGGTPSKSFSNLRPGSPADKSRKVGSIISIGLDLFRKKSSLTSSKLRPSSPVLAVGDAGHQFRMLQNCLIRWRYVNARTDNTNQTRATIAEATLVSAWAEIARLQALVMQKMVQLEREKLINFKLNRLLTWQMKSLQGWGEIERQHASALSTTQNCLQAAVQRLPLVDRAKADPQLLAIRLRQATNLTATIRSTIAMHASVVQNTVPLLSVLAQVVAEEKTLIDECVEMLGMVSCLQIQEESLRSHLVQLRSTQQQQQQQSTALQRRKSFADQVFEIILNQIHKLSS